MYTIFVTKLMWWYYLGNYSVYGLAIHLSRCVSPYLLNVYLPTAIFVVMSWVSFLIPTDVVPARIVLLVTLCLVIINTFNNVTARIPVASQVTALEVWLLACILLVFGALAEYAFILRIQVDQNFVFWQGQSFFLYLFQT